MEEVKKEIFKEEQTIIKYVVDKRNGIEDREHPEYGGMSNNAYVAICPPIKRTGVEKMFTQEELDALSNHFNDKTLYNSNSDFWKEFLTDKFGNSLSIFPIYLKKEGLILNKKNPKDFIYIRVIEHSELIGKSLNDAKSRGVKFYSVNKKDEFKQESISRNDSKKAFDLFNTYEENEKVLRFYLSQTGKAPSSAVELDYLQNQVWGDVSARPRQIIAVLSDEFLKEKIFLVDLVRYNLINRVNSLYYFVDGNKISLDSEQNDINGAAKYLASGVGQEKAMELQAKLKLHLKQEKK